MYIRQDWLDDLGLQIPTTPDELYTVLRQFKDKKGAECGLAMSNAVNGSYFSSMPSTRHGANCNILAMSEESNHIYYCVVSLRNHVVKSEFAYVNPVIVGNDDDQNKILRQY